MDVIRGDLKKDLKMLKSVTAIKPNDYDEGFMKAVEVCLDLLRGKEVDVQIRVGFIGSSIRIYPVPRRDCTGGDYK